MKIKSLQDLLVHELRDLYDAEHRILKALPKMARATSHAELRGAFEQHLEQTRQQVSRLEQAFEKLGESARKKKCLGVEGLVEEAAELMGENIEPDVLDAGLIAAAQKVEHYEVAGYGSARTWAQQLGLHEVASLLEQTLDEEKETDRKLTQLAELLDNLEARA